MADTTVSNGEFSDAQTVGSSNDESSVETRLKQNVDDLEQENGVNHQENVKYRKQVEELKALIEELKNKNVEIKKQLDKAESENKALGSLAAQASMLEGEVSSLQHDLVSAESDFDETFVDLERTMKDLEAAKQVDRGKCVQMAALGKERDLLLTEVEKLEGSLKSLRGKLEGMEKEKTDLKKSIEELEAAVESNKSLEKLNDILERTAEELKGQIITLKNCLKEKEKNVSEFEVEADRDIMIGGEDKGDLEKNNYNWLLIGGSTLAAVAAMWITICVRSAKQ